MAENDWILISDSNVRVAPDYLKKLFAHVENGVGMVTSVVAGVDAQDLGSNLESIYLNTFYARGMNIASLFNRVPVVGKSMLFRRTVADRFGGIETLSRYLAEDFMAGEAIKMLGLKIVLASDPIRQHLGRIRVSEFWNRHIRWGRIRKAQAPFVFLLEPISSLFVSGVIGALGCYGLFGVNIGWFLLAHIVVWAVCDHLLIVSIGRTISVFTLFAWLLREILYLPLWLAIAAGNKVHWRGQTLTIDADGLVYCSK
jgi:ceramide glucosyltransferase